MSTFFLRSQPFISFVSVGFLCAACDRPSTGGSAASGTTPAGTTAPAASGPMIPAASAKPDEPEPKPPPSNVPDAPAGTVNVQATKVTVEGLSLEVVKCSGASAGGMFGSVAALATIFTPLAKQKAALEACVEKQVAVSIHFASKDGKVSDVRIAGAPDAKAALCIAKIIEGSKLSQGVCVATIALRAPETADPKK